MSKKRNLTRKLIAIALSATVLAGTSFTTVGQFIGTNGISVSAGSTGSSFGGIGTIETYGDFSYWLNDDNTVAIARYTGNGGDVIIPSEFDGKNVTSIRFRAFDSCKSLTSITIPDSVTSIGEFAFNDCTGLTNITIPDSVTSIIGRDAFAGTAWYNNQPDGIVYAGKVLYNYKGTMPENTKITIPDGVTGIAGSAFSWCTNLTSINIPDSVISIGSYAFDQCTGLTSVNIPDSVTRTGFGTFKNCTGLTSVNIGNSVTEIGMEAFSGCTDLTSITIPDSVTSIGYMAFSGCTGLTSVTIGNGVTSIGESAFSDCTGLTSVTIGNSVTTIRWSAFENCTGLTSITISDSVTSIEDWAFYGCTGLTSITIPDSVTSIDRGAFENCTGLTIYGVKGSYAETYANENDIPFVSVNGYTNLSTISADKITLGKTVTVNAKAILGKGDYTYAVLYKKKADTKWTVKQNYSTNDTITIKPAKATDYDVCVKVKDSTGKIVKKFFEVKVNAKLKNTSTISATTIKKGETVTLSGSATGGTGNYTYAALYKKKSETKWTVRQGYKANSEILVRPYTNTDYDICVKIQDEEGTIAKKYFTVTVTK